MSVASAIYNKTECWEPRWPTRAVRVLQSGLAFRLRVSKYSTTASVVNTPAYLYRSSIDFIQARRVFSRVFLNYDNLFSLQLEIINAKLVLMFVSYGV